MAIGDAYATAAEYRLYRGKDGTGDDVPLDSALLAVSRVIDRELVRPNGFNKDATATVRTYIPRWIDLLDVEDIVSVNSITVDDDDDGTFSLTLAATDYELLPLNAAVGPEAEPYRQIRLTPWGVNEWRVGSRLRVTAIHGWPAVPNAIKIATIELTAILRLESPRATNAVNEMQQVISTSRAAQSIIAELKDHYLNMQAVV